MQRTVIVFGYKINRIFLRLILQLKAVASCDELVPNRNKFITLKKRLYISTVVIGGGHGTRRSQNRTNVEIPRRKSAVHACTRYCTQLF